MHKNIPVTKLGNKDFKVIYLEPAWKLRMTSYIQAFFSHPPLGYKFVSPSIQGKVWDSLSKYGFSSTVKGSLERLIPLQLIKSYVEIPKKPPREASLTYALDHCIFRKEPWILEMTFEPPYILCGTEKQLELFKGIVKRYLASQYCRKILFQLQVGMEAFIHQFGESLKDKVRVVPRAEFPRFFEKNYCTDRVKILFVNSANIQSDYIFYFKGGAEVIEAFLKLRQTYNNIELILRSVVPLFYRRKIARFKEIKVINKPIPWHELEKIWKSADIFIHPHYSNLSHALLDAMSYGLPIVTTDTWGTSEIVEDGKHGFLIHNPLAARFTEGPMFYMSDPRYMKEIRKGPQIEVVNGLVEKISLLIENPKLRERMGRTAIWEVAHGKHSIKRRNDALKRILDEATT